MQRGCGWRPVIRRDQREVRPSIPGAISDRREFTGGVRIWLSTRCSRDSGGTNSRVSDTDSGAGVPHRGGWCSGRTPCRGSCSLARRRRLTPAADQETSPHRPSYIRSTVTPEVAGSIPVTPPHVQRPSVSPASRMHCSVARHRRSRGSDVPAFHTPLLCRESSCHPQ
jgi:hypothetical protein